MRVRAPSGRSGLLKRWRSARPDETTPAAAGPPAEPLDEVDRLVADGDLAAALDVLVARNRAEPDPPRDIRLVDLRRDAAAALDPGPGRADWPPQYPDPFPDVVGSIPEARAGELSTELVGGAVAHHGALIVRGVFGEAQVARLVDAIETTHASQADPSGDGPDESNWYRPLPTPNPNEGLRRMVARQGGTWMADSPSSTEAVLAELDDAGVTGAIAGHLGERPVFSLQKSTLRRSLPSYNLVAWHQDGSFLDQDVRTMNVWVALSPCGGEQPSPGLEILPRRLPGVLPVDGVMSTHSISYELVAELAAEMPTVIPEFAPGDVIIFDELLLHRTHLTESMTAIRYAVECWFFAPSHPASAYTPLLV